MGQADSITKLLSKFWNRSAINEARARITAIAPHRPYLDQALLLLELGRRAADPVEALPRGSRPAALVGLYRDAVHAALFYRRRAEGGATSAADPAGASLASLWAESEPALLAAAGSEAKLGAARAVILDRSALETIGAASEDDAASARQLAEGLVGSLGADERRLERLLTGRWLRVAGAAALALLVAFGVSRLVASKDLAAGRPLSASSVDPECPSAPVCVDILFHTRDEVNPWVEIDLGAMKTVRRIEVANRLDCCQERAFPLVVELGNAQKAFVPVARRDTAFKTWSAKFPPRSARFVRLTVQKRTMFHLSELHVY
jgi:hypothetical protein